jgi:hypothetical protein
MVAPAWSMVNQVGVRPQKTCCMVDIDKRVVLWISGSVAPGTPTPVEKFGPASTSKAGFSRHYRRPSPPPPPAAIPFGRRPAAPATPHRRPPPRQHEAG